MVVKKNSLSGFTLIEVMIVVVIIGILAAIAYPSYQQQVRKTKRVEAQSEMMEVARQLQKYKVANFSFEKADGSFVTLADVQKSSNIPANGPTTYTLALSDVAMSRWTLIATPTGAQTGDGQLILRHNNQKCWTKGGTCTPSATTNWDGR